MIEPVYYNPIACKIRQDKKGKNKKNEFLQSHKNYFEMPIQPGNDSQQIINMQPLNLKVILN